MSKLLAGRYELIDKIGEGGMAVVYKAKDRLLNRYVAIKILRPEFTKDAQFVDSFRRESQAAAGLQHPNIVSIYDVGKTGNINYIVMELVEGRPLSDIITEKGPLDYRTTIDITKQVAAALSLAHKHQIIHRDVKPHNIMITEDGVAKLTDFGIARAVSTSTLVAETSRIIGSVHYFSPEQARGAYVDERSDIYSLGIVMYEMLTGRVPFDGENPVEVALKHINQDMIPPSKLVDGIPPALEKMVMKATDKFQTNRYSTADELLEDLTNMEFVTSVVGDGVVRVRGNSTNTGRQTRVTGDKPEAERFSRESENEIRGSRDHEPGNDRDYDARGSRGSERGKKGGRSGNGSGGSDHGRSRLLALIAIIGIVILALVFLILRVTGMIGGKDAEEVTVPDLTGQTYAAAQAQLESLGLTIEQEAETVASAEVPEGCIVFQSPVKDTKVKEGRTVRVTISAGNVDIKVPTLVNKSYEEAQTIVSGMGLFLIRGEDVDNDRVEAGYIVKQSPEPGTVLPRGDSITVNVSTGKQEKSVPRLIGQEYVSDEEMEAVLENYGLTLGNVSYKESHDEPGLIIEQDPSPGKEVEKGTAVDIVISKAKSTGQIPYLYGLTQSEAENAIKNAGFTVGQITEEETAELDGGHVLRQYPAADTEMELNSPIDLIMSKAKTMVPIPSLNGMTLENAQAALDAVGLVIGQIGSEETNEYAEGTVARQYPAADVKVEPGSTVDLWLASPIPEEEPGGDGGDSEYSGETLPVGPDGDTEEPDEPTDEETSGGEEGTEGESNG
ncbi:MAG: Stk1 family PASTA domain-containing Ser/Thr kinase [Firmicutes bacterium]|nr:Stk1 family PASTA domain-containing Ser/Thr kinase [Bacillota bacterium]